jgi:hypothetical protein
MSTALADLAAEEKRLTERLQAIREARAAQSLGMTAFEVELARCANVVHAYATPFTLRRLADRMAAGLEARGGEVSEDPAGYLFASGSSAVALVPDPAAQRFPYMVSGRRWA